ncbi:MAG: thiamine diphosphokinase [Muribaculaceae bacterium]|nr:thiamine diphosphokinase [Muribaculaceae bacterium]
MEKYLTSIEDFNPEAIIIDAGTFPTSPIALRWLDLCDKIVCCDGAANEFVATRYTPWRIVGDGDSMSADVRVRYSDIIRRNPDQETNDQTKAVKYLAERGVSRIVILGATGRREDHTLGNISLLMEYLRHGIEARIYTDYGVFIPASGTRTFRCAPGSQVSIFNFGATEMRADNLVYPIRPFRNWWEGTLNETSAPHFTIHSNAPYLIFLNY